MEKTLLEKIKIVSEWVGSDHSDKRESEMLVLLGQIKQEVEEIERVVNSDAYKLCESPYLENMKQEIDTLHERCGDHKVSDCCGDEIYCGNCDNKQLCKRKCICENYEQYCLKCKKSCGYKFEDCEHKWVFEVPGAEALFIPKGEREKTKLFDVNLVRERIDTKNSTDEDEMTMMLHCEKCHHWKEVNWTEYSLV